MLISLLCYVATALGVAGAILNVYKHYACFVVWEIANVLLFTYNLAIGEYCQAGLFFVYGVITGWGLIRWIKEMKKT